MKIKLLFAFLLVSFFAVAQPTNYQNIAARYRWMAGYFIDGFHVPGYSTVPNLRTGVWPGAGNIGLDTVAHKFYFYSGGTWREVAPAIDSLIWSTRAWRQKGDDSLGAVKWGLTGNAGLDTSKFLGTTGNQHLYIRVNNDPAGIIYSNPAIDPTNAPGGGVAMGHLSGENLIKGVKLGNFPKFGGNTLYGYASGRNLGVDWGVTGKPLSDQNTFIGQWSGYWNQIANGVAGEYGRNVGVGQSSLYRNVSGSDNTANGTFSLEGNDNGNGNTATGRDALRSNVSGNYNVANGDLALGYVSGGVSSCTITNGGSGYTTATATFSPPFGGAVPGICFGTATGTVQLSGGAVVGITITDPGCAYSTSRNWWATTYQYPENIVTITGDGVGATATVNISSANNNIGVGFGAGFGARMAQNGIYIGKSAGISTRYKDTSNIIIGTNADVDGSISTSTNINQSIALGHYAKVKRSYQLGISDSINSFTFRGISRGTAGYVLTDSLGDGEYWVARPSGSGSYTFSNGLTEAAGAVKLGGTLSENTTINGGGKNLTINGTDSLSIINATGDAIITMLSQDINITSGIGNVTLNGQNTYINRAVMQGQVNIDTLPVALVVTGKKIMLLDTATGLVQNIDPALLGFGATNTLAVFGAGAGLSTDTAAFQLTSIYGSFFWDGTDTLIVTKSCVTLQGTSANIDYDIYFNDSLNVTAGASTVLSSINITSTTTAYCTDEGFITTKIPPGNWVWVKTSTLTTKPTYFSLSLIGYKKRVI